LLPLEGSTPDDSLPEVALVPDQLPVAVQAVALVDDQLSVVDAPFSIDVGFAAIDTVGIGDSASSGAELSVSSTPPHAERPRPAKRAANPISLTFNSSASRLFVVPASGKSHECLKGR